MKLKLKNYLRHVCNFKKIKRKSLLEEKFISTLVLNINY